MSSVVAARERYRDAVASLPYEGINARAEARAWLARELHDGVVQQLTTMVVEIEALKRRLEAADDLGRLQLATRTALAELRQLLCRLRDEPTIDAGFVDSLRGLIDEFQATSGIAAELIVSSWTEVLPYAAASDLRRIVAEALTNARRHSGARRVTVTLRRLDDALEVTIVDDGRGMDSASNASGFGVRGMRERASLLGGQLSLTATPGFGTTLSCIVPVSRPT